MSKIEIIKSWYPNEVLSNDEALAIYDQLLKFMLLLHQAKSNKKEIKDG